MCVNCGGTCGKRKRAPRFTSNPGTVDLHIKGTAGGVDHIPDALITSSGGMLTYERLFTTLGPDGQPAVATVPGTFGNYATRARLERH